MNVSWQWKEVLFAVNIILVVWALINVGMGIFLQTTLSELISGKKWAIGIDIFLIVLTPISLWYYSRLKATDI